MIAQIVPWTILRMRVFRREGQVASGGVTKLGDRSRVPRLLLVSAAFCALLCLNFTGQVFAQSCSDQVVIACTRNYPSVSARTLDFNTFHGFQCEAHTICSGTPCFRERVCLIEPDGFEATWIFVHGNQIPPEEAIKRGMAVYRRVRADAPSAGPIRFVIWSWPSERNTNRLRDANIKQNRTNVESFLLGSYLAAIASDHPVRLIGYSFGARIVGGALHLASGGQLDGHCLGGGSEPKGREAPGKITRIWPGRLFNGNPT